MNEDPDWTPHFDPRHLLPYSQEIRQEALPEEPKIKRNRELRMASNRAQGNNEMRDQQDYTDKTAEVKEEAAEGDKIEEHEQGDTQQAE